MPPAQNIANIQVKNANRVEYQYITLLNLAMLYYWIDDSFSSITTEI